MLKAEAKSSGLGIALLVLSVRCCSAATFGFVRGELIVFLSFSFFRVMGDPEACCWCCLCVRARPYSTSFFTCYTTRYPMTPEDPFPPRPLERAGSYKETSLLRRI